MPASTPGAGCAGSTRWPADRGLEGLSTVGAVTITGVGTTSEIIAVNRDGLGLGELRPAGEVHYQGYFLDHPEAVRAYRGHDGRTYALMADNFNGRHHWFRLDGEDRIVAVGAPVALGRAAAGARRRGPPARPRRRPARAAGGTHPPLAAPLPIDGDLAKWREAGIAPQIIVTPETAFGGDRRPRDDCSAVVRLAYRGQDLYAQFLVFDDVVSFHQPVAKHYQQDGVEICLNGFLPGFKFDASVVTDAGPSILRHRFFFANLTRRSPEACPTHHPRPRRRPRRPRARADRVGLRRRHADCRVIVTEFKLPIDARPTRAAEALRRSSRSGPAGVPPRLPDQRQRRAGHRRPELPRLAGDLRQLRPRRGRRAESEERQESRACFRRYSYAFRTPDSAIGPGPPGEIGPPRSTGGGDPPGPRLFHPDR